MLNIFVNTSEKNKDPAVTYLTGYSPDFCILVYDDLSRRKCIFVASFEVCNYPRVKCFAYDPKTFRKDIQSYFKKQLSKSHKIGINQNNVSVNTVKKLRKMIPARYIDNSEAFSKSREIKSSKEIMYIKKAGAITCKLLNDIVKFTRSRICKYKKCTELEVFTFIKIWALEHNCELAFEPVVATSANSAKPHHVPGNNTLKGFTVLDVGLKYNGYCSDMTRMLYIGKPSSSEILDYMKVTSCYRRAASMLKSNLKLKVVDLAIRKHLGDKFLHALGHGVGVEIHEKPSLSSQSKDRLIENMVFTIEPGYYLKGKYGIRYENTLVFTNGKLINLTNADRKLIIID